MFPRNTLANPPYRGVANIEVSGDGGVCLTSGDAPADFRDVFFGQLSASVTTTLWSMKAHLFGVLHVLAARNPFKITDSIISLDAVDVIAKMFITRPRSTMRQQDETVNAPLFSDAVITNKPNNHICPVVNGSGYRHGGMLRQSGSTVPKFDRLASDKSGIRNFVTGVAGNLFPFHVLIISHREVAHD